MFKAFFIEYTEWFHQIISEPTHVQRSSSSCIDLIFTVQTSLVTSNGVHASLHSSCHHQIIHCAFNFNILYPSPYQRLLQNYKKDDVSKIQKTLKLVNWDRLLDNKNVDSEVLILNDFILNIFRNLVPNKNVTFDDKDPVWMNENIKLKIKAKNKRYQEYVKKGRQETDFCALEEFIRNLNDLIPQTKTSYYENLVRKLNDPTLQSKTYWSILKGFYNGKRMLVIPPLLVNNKFVTDFKVKANIFNDLFSKQCTPLANRSKLPENQVYLTNSRINSVPFSDDLVINIIRNSNVNKAHGHDNISIRMIKMCDGSLLRPLSIIFRNSLKSSIYPSTWKKANVIPAHKKRQAMCQKLPPCVAPTSICENF